MSKRWVQVKAPASSANLGPGFDVLAVALDLWLTLTVEETGSFELITDLDVPKDRSNLAVRAFERAGGDPDNFRFTIESEIPLSGGLGSSAAVTLCAVAAGELLKSGIKSYSGDYGFTVADGSEVFVINPLPLAAEIEGHSDNASAAYFGGLTVGVDGDRIETPEGIAAVLLIPDQAVPTSQARAALRAEVPLADAVFNIEAAVKLTLAFARNDLGMLQRALVDRLHQDYRRDLYPRSYDLMQRAKEFGAIGATISGAGPTVLFWVKQEESKSVAAKLASEAAGWAEVKETNFQRSGVDNAFKVELQTR